MFQKRPPWNGVFLFLFAIVGISVAEEMKQEIPQPQVDGFRSTDNLPLKPVHYTFTTKAEATETKEIE